MPTRGARAPRDARRRGKGTTPGETVLALGAARVVGVVELGDAREPRLLGAALALELLVLLELGPGQDAVDDARLLDRLEELVGQHALGAEPEALRVAPRPRLGAKTSRAPSVRGAAARWRSLVVSVSLVCESKAGLTMSAST